MFQYIVFLDTRFPFDGRRLRVGVFKDDFFALPEKDFAVFVGCAVDQFDRVG